MQVRRKDLRAYLDAWASEHIAVTDRAHLADAKEEEALGWLDDAAGTGHPLSSGVSRECRSERQNSALPRSRRTAPAVLDGEFTLL